MNIAEVRMSWNKVRQYTGHYRCVDTSVGQTSRGLAGVVRKVLESSRRTRVNSSMAILWVKYLKGNYG